jgi:hypothetical protein
MSMELPPLVVWASGGVYHVDLNQGTDRRILPYAAALASTPSSLFVARFEHEQTRLARHDAHGLVWMRRVPGCFDTHAVALMPDGGMALCSTGSNEIVFVDGDGRELRRWTPDPTAEFDSWHINSLTLANGKLYGTCFGRFSQFRGYIGRVVECGMIVEVDSGKVMIEGLSAPHDPYRLDKGWLVNDSDRRRLVFLPDGGRPQVLFESSGYPRGLVVLPAHYVVGVSSIRGNNGGDTSTIALIERGTNRLVRTLAMPCAEIGGMCLAPERNVIDAIEREQHNEVSECFGLLPTRGDFPLEDRVGSIEIVGVPTRLPTEPGSFEVTLRLNNRSRRIWSFCHEPPLSITYTGHDRGGECMAEGERTAIPMAIYPGRTTTLKIRLNPTPAMVQTCAYLRYTLVQDGSARWEDSATWKTATLSVPRW